MKPLSLIALATATALPALATFNATGMPAVTLSELSQGERPGIDNPRPWDTAELSQGERPGIDNPQPWDTAELSQGERPGIHNPQPWTVG